MRSGVLILGLLFSSLLMVLASCGPTTPDPGSKQLQQAQSAVTVNIPPNAMGMGPAAFGTNPLVIAAGTTVTWVNTDSIPHTATSDTGVWDSGTLQPGQNFQFTFNTPGTFPYHCAIHGAASMSGTIEVTGASPTPGPTSSPAVSPTPTPTQTASPTPSPSIQVPSQQSGGKGGSTTTTSGGYSYTR